ncbi:MAG: tyrosine-type recombinase/integrase [Verrucomicrobiota bacterium]|nr:tyrosine-type recombinase/integrase [Verrucomicrobiota bacterium]
MKVIPNSYRIYRRQASGYFYFVDETQGKPKHTSLKTKDPQQAQRILDARIMGRTLPAMAKEVGNAYLREGDPEAKSHTWRRVIEECLICKKRGKSTQERIENAAKDKALLPLLDRAVGETKATEIFEVIRNGGVATNVFLRRFHNFALELSWIHKPILTKSYWPKVVFSPKIAITSEQHEMIMSQETHPERRAYYQLCWFFGGSNSDMAHLRAENIDWERGTVTFIRRKTKALCHQAFGRECAEVLKTLPTSGPLFPYLVKLRACDRATVFKQRCSGLGIEGVTIHSHRYAWAERAAIAGMPERFAQAALGHGSKAVHRAYARRAELHVPCLEELTEVRRLTIARARIEAGVQEIRIAA